MNNSDNSRTRTPDATIEAGVLEDTFNGVAVPNNLKGAELCRWTLEQAKQKRTLELLALADQERLAKETLRAEMSALRSKAAEIEPQETETNAGQISHPPVLTEWEL
jgi:hypothetical protein